MAVDAADLSRARESRAAIERLYVEMRHLLNSGSIKSLGAPGDTITNALMTLRPEIYGSLVDPEKVELDGLVYVIDRLPKGIEECRFIKLVSEEGYSASHFEVSIPASRRRSCYRIDKDHMFIEVTRGRSDVYDILTHLTFLFIEARKIKEHALDENREPRIEWIKLRKIIKGEAIINEANREVALTYLSTILGRTFEATKNAFSRMEAHSTKNNGLFHIVYWLGKLAIEEENEGKSREISFSPTLRTRIGHHIYGERWANNIKQFLLENNLLSRPLHIISANLHSVMNSLYAWAAIRDSELKKNGIEGLVLELSKEENSDLGEKIKRYALKHGMYELQASSSTHISVQIFDTAKVDWDKVAPSLLVSKSKIMEERPVMVVMDYAFGEQAYETMDELLKPYEPQGAKHNMPVKSISIMGKAGILEGGKGDIMVPNGHIFEGTADNYPFENDFRIEDFQADYEGNVLEGPMITVLGTSLQNRDVLAYFKHSSWQTIGLEMEGAHYQKAIQAQAKIRKNISDKVILRYAYYASDNPLVTGGTLASGSLGAVGVRPTYLITKKILTKILGPTSTILKSRKKGETIPSPGVVSVKN
ncbi:MAG: hypothetical protein AAF824_01785 [Bacteroidota bacterium]